MDKYEARLAVAWNSIVEYQGKRYVAVELSQVHYPEYNDGRMYLHLTMSCLDANCVIGADPKEIKVADWRMHEIYVNEKLTALRAAGELLDKIEIKAMNKPIEGYGRWRYSQT